MDFKYLENNADKSKAIMLLYGGIGSEIDGNQFAREIHALSNIYNTIEIRINSGGGSVPQGLSIFNAILNSEAKVITKIEGLAASMAGVIATAGDEIQMNDFARLMVHDPSFANGARLNAKMKKSLDVFKNMLVDIFTRRGIGAEEASGAMTKETWYTAEEASEAKLIDSILDTGKNKKVQNELNLDIAAELQPKDFDKYINENTNIKNSEMKLIAKSLGLAENATEADVLAKLNELQSNLETVTGEKDTLQTENDAFKANAEAKQKEAVNTIIDKVINDGHFEEDSRDNLVEMASNNFESFEKMASGLKAVGNGSIMDKIDNSKNEGGDEPTKEDGSDIKDNADRYDYLYRNNPGALAEIESSDPDLFNKMFDAFELKFG